MFPNWNSEPMDAMQFSNPGEETEDKDPISDLMRRNQKKRIIMEWSEYDCDWLDECEEGE